MIKDLIIDVGMHNGTDSEFYLGKGFRVVAIEANPELAHAASERLAPHIASGRLKVLNVGVHQKEGEFDFYVNLDKDDWSSFVEWVGARDNTRHKVIKVPCTNFGDILKKHGMPYYLKIDIERFDIHVLESLHGRPDKPKYISVEAHHIGYLAHLWVLGYRKFKLVNQRELWREKCPNPAKEGVYFESKFGPHSSGPFGEESPGPWTTYEQAVYRYLTEVASPDGKGLADGAWFDFHATY